jgi:hypothetical protein
VAATAEAVFCARRSRGFREDHDRFSARVAHVGRTEPSLRRGDIGPASPRSSALRDLEAQQE